MLFYAITNRHLLSGEEPGAPSSNLGAPSLPRSLRQGWEARTAALLLLARQWASSNINYIQIREKDLTPNDLRELTRAIVSSVREINQTTKVLLNGPASIALAAGAGGVHLPATAPPNAAAEVRSLFAQSGRDAILSHSCHSINEVLKVREKSQRDPHATSTNTLILYAPVFEKFLAPSAPDQPSQKIPGQGLDALRAAVHAAGNIPVLALGGITPENTPACLAAGASGIAAIRIFLPGYPHLMGSS